MLTMNSHGLEITIAGCVDEIVTGTGYCLVLSIV